MRPLRGRSSVPVEFPRGLLGDFRGRPRARDDVNFRKFLSVKIYRTHRVSPERLRRCCFGSAPRTSSVSFTEETSFKRRFKCRRALWHASYTGRCARTYLRTLVTPVRILYTWLRARNDINCRQVSARYTQQHHGVFVENFLLDFLRSFVWSVRAKLMRVSFAGPPTVVRDSSSALTLEYLLSGYVSHWNVECKARKVGEKWSLLAGK